MYCLETNVSLIQNKIVRNLNVANLKLLGAVIIYNSSCAERVLQLRKLNLILGPKRTLGQFSGEQLYVMQVALLVMIAGIT